MIIDTQAHLFFLFSLTFAGTFFHSGHRKVIIIECFPGLKGSGLQKSIIVGIVVVRYIALPLTGILIIKGAHQIGVVHSDPLYRFILMMQYAVPPAMNIGIYISNLNTLPSCILSVKVGLV